MIHNSYIDLGKISVYRDNAIKGRRQICQKCQKQIKGQRTCAEFWICIIAVGFLLGGCLKTLEWISNLLPDSPEDPKLDVKPDTYAKNVKIAQEYQYIPAIYSDTKIFDRNNVKLKLYIGGNTKHIPDRKFVGVYLRKPGFIPPNSGVDDYRNIEGWTLLKEYPIEEFESFERTERKRIGGVYLDMYLTEITIPKSFFTEEKADFYLVVYPIWWDKDSDKWYVVIRTDFDLHLTYELLPDNEVKIYETEY